MKARAITLLPKRPSGYHALRASLPPREKPARRETKRERPLIQFLNSALGLWLLSTLFLSIGSWLYAEWSQSRAEAARRHEQMEKLDTEISSRLDNGSLLLTLFRDVRDLERPHAAPFGDLPERVLLPPRDGSGVFTEFAGRNLRSLLVELRSVMKGEPDEVCISQALGQERFLRYRWLGSPLAREQVKAFSDDVEALADNRWSDRAQVGRLTQEADEIFNGSTDGRERYCETVLREHFSNSARGRTR
jgi:hypothetical protein